MGGAPQPLSFFFRDGALTPSNAHPSTKAHRPHRAWYPRPTGVRGLTMQRLYIATGLLILTATLIACSDDDPQLPPIDDCITEETEAALAGEIVDHGLTFTDPLPAPILDIFSDHDAGLSDFEMVNYREQAIDFISSNPLQARPDIREASIVVVLLQPEDQALPPEWVDLRHTLLICR